MALKKPKPKHAKAGKLAKLKLKPKNATGAAVLLQALELGVKTKASFKVTVDDGAGHTATKKLKVKLK